MTIVGAARGSTVGAGVDSCAGALSAGVKPCGSAGGLEVCGAVGAADGGGCAGAAVGALAAACADKVFRDGWMAAPAACVTASAAACAAFTAAMAAASPAAPAASKVLSANVSLLGVPSTEKIPDVDCDPTMVLPVALSLFER